jgi:predicted enzyme related to lactoylglutathione lyase
MSLGYNRKQTTSFNKGARMILANGQFRFVFRPKDFEASSAFYRKGLELPVDHEWDYGGGDRGIVFFAAAGMIELLGLAEGQEYVRPQGVDMLIQVDDADRWAKYARERSLTVVQAPTTFPWGHRVVRLQDPDGITVSLFAVVSA